MLSFVYCLHSEEQNNVSTKVTSQEGSNLRPSVIHSDAYLTDITWQALIERYLTSLLLVHQLTFGLR